MEGFRKAESVHKLRATRKFKGENIRERRPQKQTLISFDNVGEYS